MRQQFVTVLAILALIPAGFAQSPGVPGRGFSVTTGPGLGPDGQLKYRTFISSISSEFSFDGAVVKNAPYSAEAVTETTQRLADGNRISQKTTAKLYRDSEGRTRREETLGAVGPWATNPEPGQSIFINDPVSKTNLVLDSRSRTVHKIPSPEFRTLTLNTAGGTTAGISVQADMVKRVVTGASAGPNETWTVAVPAPGNNENEKDESLGTQIIEGVRADGTRTKVTIPAGSIGNDLPIEMVSERWYSPELRMVVMTKHNDPRMGETVYRLTNVSRSEPSRSLFEAPADYTVIDEQQMKRADEEKMLLREKLKVKD